MSIVDILECNNVETLKKICVAQRHILSVIGNICVSESKCHYTSDTAIEKIRDCLNRGQYEMEV